MVKKPLNIIHTRIYLVPIIVLTVLIGLFVTKGNIAQADVTCNGDKVMDVVAHQDDDLLFQSPDLLHNVRGGSCLRTVYMTAGDAGLGSSYWLGRENGSKAAYAYMLSDASNNWTTGSETIDGHPLVVYTNVTFPNITLEYMRLPDGSQTGAGYSSTSYESLQKLWTNSITYMHSIDGSATYTKSDLINTLTDIMAAYQPTQIRAQDYVGTYGDGDHSDHHSAAYFAQAAHRQYSLLHGFTGYKGYPISSLPQNVSSDDANTKLNTFLAYAPYDSRVCQTASSCLSGQYGPWFSRQYTSGTENGGTSSPPTTQITAPASGDTLSSTQTITADATDTSGILSVQFQLDGKNLGAADATAPYSIDWDTSTTCNGNHTLTSKVTNSNGITVTSSSVNVTVTNQAPTMYNVACLATASASSQNNASYQYASKAIDGSTLGYPVDYASEWATVSGKAGSWLNLSWSSAHVVSKVILNDRPNLNDQITAATLTFSDGSTVAVGSLPNDGTAATYTFTPRSTTSLKLTVNSVSKKTSNIGLAEITVLGD